MKRIPWRPLLLGLAALAFLAAFGWVVATQGPLAPIKVTVARAAETTLNPSLFGIGTVEARHSYAIGPTAAGRVARVLVDQGDVVSKGQLLAEMDPVDLDARQAAGAAASARAVELAASARAALAEAASRAQIASSNRQRYADLRRRNFVSQEAEDAKAHEAAAAQAGQQAAAAALAAAQQEQRRARSDERGLGKSREHLRLTSPVDGVVSARLAEPGSTLVAGQSVVQVIDPASLWLRLRIDQGLSAGLATGLPAQIRLRSQPGRVVQGRVARVDLVGDAVAEESIANVVFDAAPAGLAIGDMAEVTVQLPPLEHALAVPAAAVKRVGERTGAWRLQDGRAEFSTFATGRTSADGLTQVLSSLAVGDEVIVHSQRALAPGVKVRVVDVVGKAAP
jgi:HlyD family secretion protein